MKSFAKICLGTLLLLLLCACGAPAGDPAAAPSQPPQAPPEHHAAAAVIEPSSLISKEEAEEILGVTLDTAESSEQEQVGLKQRFYGSEDHFLQLSLTQQAMMPAEQRQTPESLYRAIVENFEDAIPVEGIGDEAHFATPGLHILKDGYYILIAVGNLDDAGNREKLVEAGRLALENLAAAVK